MKPFNNYYEYVHHVNQPCSAHLDFFKKEMFILAGDSLQGKCEEHQFKCVNKRCVNMDKVCDNIDDCGDLSDESGCRE